MSEDFIFLLLFVRQHLARLLAICIYVYQVINIRNKRIVYTVLQLISIPRVQPESDHKSFRSQISHIYLKKCRWLLETEGLYRNNGVSERNQRVAFS